MEEISQSRSREWDDRLNNPIHHRRHIRIICVGAGASGLLFAYKLQRSFEEFSLTIYEKNEGVAGTWFENRYPGVACDYPAHNYTYSFEPKPDWPSVYVSGPEIRGYFEDFKSKYGLERYCKTKCQVDRAEWKDETGEWIVQSRDLISGDTIEQTCDILINAAGVLNQWRWPDIPGLHDFKGELMHSAKWNEETELKNKRVGLIGNGSSGQQILESIQGSVAHLDHFIRQGTWIFGPFGPEPPRAYTQIELKEFAETPGVLLELRKKNESRINSAFEAFLSDSKAQASMRGHIEHEMRAKLQSLELEGIIIPQTGVGCRRPTPGINYLESLAADNVSVVYGEIAKVTSNGCISSSGKEYPLDVLICATGFDTSYIPRFQLIGQGGVKLADEWATQPRAYLAIAVPKFPNYLIFYGPNNPFASGPFLSTIECQADYMLKLIDRYQTENMHSFAPKSEAVADFMSHAAKILARTVWAEDCRSWYKASQKQRGPGTGGPPSSLSAVNSLTIWPGSGLHYIEAMADVRADDWDITYRGNRFEWLGNGFSQTETDGDSDLAWYVRERDDGPYLSKDKRRRLQTRKNSTINSADGEVSNGDRSSY